MLLPTLTGTLGALDSVFRASELIAQAYVALAKANFPLVITSCTPEKVDGVDGYLFEAEHFSSPDQQPFCDGLSEENKMRACMFNLSMHALADTAGLTLYLLEPLGEAIVKIQDATMKFEIGCPQIWHLRNDGYYTHSPYHWIRVITFKTSEGEERNFVVTPTYQQWGFKTAHEEMVEIENQLDGGETKPKFEGMSSSVDKQKNELAMLATTGRKQLWEACVRTMNCSLYQEIVKLGGPLALFSMTNDRFKMELERVMHKLEDDLQATREMFFEIKFMSCDTSQELRRLNGLVDVLTGEGHKIMSATYDRYGGK